MEICKKAFFADIHSVFDFCAGFESYFENHPEEKGRFPGCNAPAGLFNRKKIKTREMFIGKKTEPFAKLLELLQIEPDCAFLEAEYYLTPRGKGKVYDFENGPCKISFDFYIDPTSQFETCAIALEYPSEKDGEILSLIRTMQKNYCCISPFISNGDFKTLYRDFNIR